jgi:hypothetical protein
LYARLLDQLEGRPRMMMSEASWVLESNTTMNNAVAAMGGRRYKTWRMYERRL